MIKTAISLFLWTGSVTPPKNALPEAAVASPADEAKEASVTRAFEAFGARQFTASSAKFEALWSEFSEPRFLFNAAISRFSARHFAHAVMHLESYLRLTGLTAEDLAVARSQLEAARAKTRQVRLAGRLATEPSKEIWVDLEHEAEPGLRPALRVALPVVAGKFTGSLYLDPGGWRIQAQCPPGSQTSAAHVLVGESSKPVEVLLECQLERPPVSTQAHVRRRSAIASGAFGGATLVVGALVAGVFIHKRDALLQREDLGTVNNNATRWFIWFEVRAAAGLALVGVGAGAAIGAGTTAIQSDRWRRLAYLSELAVGGGMVLGAMVARHRFLVVENHKRETENWEQFRMNSVTTLSRDLTADTFVGLGVGLLASASAGLLIAHIPARSSTRAKKSRSWQVSAAGSGHFSGLTVSGRF